jgi:hypothetical protein
MKPLVLTVLAAASLAGSAGAAAAQPWPGGFYDDDRGPYYRHRYRERDYTDHDRYYHRREYRERRGYRTPSGCRPGFTVQDGVCKPYRGY